MAIIAVSEVYQGRKASQQLDKFQRKYTRNFQVRATRDLTEYDIINGAGLPVVGVNVHPQDTVCLCTGKNASESALTTEAGNTALWVVSVEYESQSSIQTNPNPLARELVVSATSQSENESLLEDLSDPPKKVLNSADEPFDAPIEKKKSLTRLSITKNYDYLTTDIHTFLDPLVDTCNSGDWWLWSAAQCRMDGINWQIKIEEMVKYYEIVFNISVDTENGFDPVRVLDRGYRVISGIDIFTDTYEYQTILDGHGTPLTKPHLLDGLGQELEATADPVYLEFTLYPRVSWATVPSPGY